MRKIFTLAALAAAAVATSCATSDTLESALESAQPGPDGFYTVSLALQGDITVSESPLSRADEATGDTTPDTTPDTTDDTTGEATADTTVIVPPVQRNDLYGVNIFYDREKDGATDDVYGYGLFDNVEAMQISMLPGYKYRFECTLVKDGKSKIFYGRDKSYDTSTSPATMNMVEHAGYSAPFRTSAVDASATGYYPYGQDNTVLLNRFVTGSSAWAPGSVAWLPGLAKGDSAMAEFRGMLNDAALNPSYNSSVGRGYVQPWPATDRYYGELVYTPFSDGVVAIDMRRVSFGVKFDVTGLTDGYLEVSSDFVHKYIYAASSVYEAIYTFNDVAGCTGNYSQTFSVRFSWHHANGPVQTLAPKNITFKRNILTTVAIDLGGVSDDATIGIVEESTPMGSETVDVSFDEE